MDYTLKKQGLQYGLYPNRLFVGEVLVDEEDRMFIIDTITGCYANKKIRQTRLIYSFPLMAVLNPHVTIDGVPNYVVIMTLCARCPKGKPYMIAMYSEKEQSQR